MLQIQQGRLHAATKANALSILQREINLYQTNFGIIATQASILTGFAFSLLSFQLGREVSFLNRTLFTAATSAAMGFNLIAVVMSTTCGLQGPRLALLGTEEDVPRVVLGLHDAHHKTVVCNRLGVMFFFLSAIQIGWCVRENINAILSTLIIGALCIYCLWLMYGVEVLFNLSKDGEFSRLYNFKSRVDNITEGRRSDYDQQLQILEKPTRRVAVHKVLNQIRRRRASMHYGAGGVMTAQNRTPGTPSNRPVVKSGIVAYRAGVMTQFEPRYIELQRGELKIRKHRGGSVNQTHILQDQECEFTELRDQGGVHAFECQIGREKLSCQVESVQAVDSWIHALNQCSFQEEDADAGQDTYSFDTPSTVRVGTTDV
jgi:hypothetical protein